METEVRFGAVCLVVLLLTTSSAEPEVCITFLELESSIHDFILRCNFTNAPNITNITWTYPSVIYPDEADRFLIETTSESVEEEYLTELRVSEFNETIDEGEYYCIGQTTGDILFGGHFLINKCDDISMDPAFLELVSLSEEATVELAVNVLSLANELYDTYEAASLDQDELDVFVDIIDTVSNINFTERNQTMNILKPFLDLTSETLNVPKLEVSKLTV
ncbi:uncharacterized protein [Antedon mediterranea]|uniref:uncharacterized protein n=1 Tax=Antedon mediterranea TaxID=105859 RepID=UPI003AF9F91B